jgi:hypothetical protein
MKHNSNYDIDLKKGQIAEELVRYILTKDSGCKLEVKNDEKAGHSGNLYVEYRSRANHSGLSTTMADWWAFVLGGSIFNNNLILLFQKDYLKEVADFYKLRGRGTPGGDSNTSGGTIIPLSILLGWKDHNYIKDGLTRSS